MKNTVEFNFLKEMFDKFNLSKKFDDFTQRLYYRKQKAFIESILTTEQLDQIKLDKKRFEDISNDIELFKKDNKDVKIYLCEMNPVFIYDFFEYPKSTLKKLDDETCKYLHRFALHFNIYQIHQEFKSKYKISVWSGKIPYEKLTDFLKNKFKYDEIKKDEAKITEYKKELDKFELKYMYSFDFISPFGNPERKLLLTSTSFFKKHHTKEYNEFKYNMKDFKDEELLNLYIEYYQSETIEEFKNFMNKIKGV